MTAPGDSDRLPDPAAAPAPAGAPPGAPPGEPLVAPAPFVAPPPPPPPLAVEPRPHLSSDGTPAPPPIGPVDRPPLPPLPQGAPEPSAYSLETPALPLPSPLEPEPPPQEPAAPAPGLVPAMRYGLAHAWRCRRPLLVVLLAQLLLAASVVGPLRARLGPRLDAQAHAPALGGHPDALDLEAGWSGGVDVGVLADVRRAEAPFLDGLGLAIAWVMLAAWVFGAFAAGGFLATADAPPERGRVTAARFLEGGGRWFWPCLRTSLAFAVAYAVAGRLVFELWAGVAAATEDEAPSQAVAWHGARLREGVFLGAFLVLRVVADLARARLVALPRRSATLAFLRSFATLVRHPIRALGLAAGLGLLEAAVLAGCAGLLASVPGGSALEVTVAFALFQAAVLARWGARAALLASYVHLQHAHFALPLRTPARPASDAVVAAGAGAAAGAPA